MSSRIPAAAAVGEIFFFILTIAAAGAWLRRSPIETRRKQLLLAAACLSVVAKVGLASLGHNYDVDSWRVASNIIAQGQSVYANTVRYNYGPIWAWLVSGFGHLAGLGTGERFHVWIAAFLAAVDILTAIAISESYSWIAGMMFLLSPVGWLISGLHSQFDNLAVLLALAAWLLIRAGKPRLAGLLVSSACLGVSLIVKHVFFLFPIWLLFWKPLGRLRHRILYVAIAYACFAGSFMPWWGDPASRAGIVGSVLGYNSFYGQSWLGYTIGLFVPITSLDAFLKWIPLISGFKALWIGVMLGAGLLLARRENRDLFLFYLMVLYASSPSLAAQYAAIPMAAAAVFCAAWESWAFLAAGTLANLFTSSNGRILLHRPLPEVAIAGHIYYVTGVFDDYLHPFFLIASQFCIGALLVREWRGIARPVARPLVADIGKAGVLILAGGFPVVLAKKVLAYFARFLAR